MATTLTGTHEPRPLRWTQDAYRQMASLGLFSEMRVELIQGEIIDMAPMGPKHFRTTNRVRRVLASIFEPDDSVLCPVQLDLSRSSMPEPDVCVVSGNFENSDLDYPTSALLVVEVSDSSLSYDTRQKAAIYAEAAIPEYWIINLISETVEVRRSPRAGSDDRAAFYAETTNYMRGELIAPLGKPHAQVAVEQLLPL